jgi:hypothetical protein
MFEVKYLGSCSLLFRPNLINIIVLIIYGIITVRENRDQYDLFGTYLLTNKKLNDFYHS